MIRRIYSSLASFKEVEFHDGLNVLAADKTQGSTETQTRNGAGKSSLVELIHFLLGASVSSESMFRSDVLRNESFAMEFDADRPLTVRRRGEHSSRVEVSGLDRVSTNVDGRLLDMPDESLHVDEWRDYLGAEMFGLPSEPLTPPPPSFRLLFPYFARRRAVGGFLDPTKHFGQQSGADVQVALSYLLSLDWTLARAWQGIASQRKRAKALRDALTDEYFGSVVGRAAELRSEVLVEEDRVRNRRSALAEFHVVPAYREMEAEADALGQEIHRLADENTLDRELLTDLQQSMEADVPPDVTRLQEVYRELGLSLPDLIARRYDEVAAFHQSVVANRQEYLRVERAGAEERIERRHAETARLDARRAELLRSLRAGGALDQYTAMHSELVRLEARAAELRNMWETAQKFEDEQNQADLKRQELVTRATMDLAEREEAVNRAVLAFRRFSGELYGDRAGNLSIAVGKNGYEFRLTIEGDESAGISHMQIFCFDMMLMRARIEQGLPHPGFLVHDSHLFDGVDERQKATALKIGANEADELGFQYIVTFNTDDLPGEEVMPEGFDIRRHLLDVKLTDATETGGLFGIRF